MIYDFELGFNYIIYNEFKIFNIKIILYVLQMIEKFEVLKLKKIDFVLLFYSCWFIRFGSIFLDRYIYNIRMWLVIIR